MSWTTPVSLQTLVNTANASTYTIPSCTLTINRFYVVFIFMRGGTGDTILPMTIAANGSGAWTDGEEILLNSGSNDRIGYFYKFATATETSTIVITTNQGSQSNMMAALVEFAANEVHSTPFQQTKVEVTGGTDVSSLDCDLTNVPATRNLSVVAFAYRNATAISPDADFTEGADLNLGGTGSDAGRLEWQYHTALSTDQHCTATGATIDWGAIHLELRSISVGAESDDVLVRLGSMDATTGSGLVTANFTPTGGAAAVVGGMMMPYYRDIVQGAV